MPTWATPGVGIRGRGWLIPTEAPGRFDCLEFVEVEFVDSLQGFGGGSFLEAVGQGLQPGPVFGLKGEQDSDSLVPAPGAASAVGRSAVMDHRPGRGAGGTMPGLSFGIGHRAVAERLAGHEVHSEALRNGTVRLSDRLAGDQARCLKRQLSLPVSMISQWWVRRSSSAVVILASPKTLGHSPKARLVVTMMEVRS